MVDISLYKIKKGSCIPSTQTNKYRLKAQFNTCLNSL